MESLERRTLLSVTPISDVLAHSIASATDLSSYSADQLAAVDRWLIAFDEGRMPDPAILASQLNARFVGTVSLPNSLVLEFDAPWQFVAAQLEGLPDQAFFYPLVRHDVEKLFIPNDPYFNFQWHLENTGQTGGENGQDANVVPAWDKVLGEGVVIAIVDDSLQHVHQDIRDKYRADLSFDFNEGDADPSPVFASDNHGTAVAGVAAGHGNNGTGVTGSAPLAQIAGLRLIGEQPTDFDIAAALTHMNQEIDIYNNSWGFGRGIQVPPVDIGPPIAFALENGAQFGRGGLGSIFLFAAGNSNEVFDNTNYSGLTKSRFVITVAGIDDNGEQALYSTPGASILIAAHTWSGDDPDSITTTDRIGAQGYNFLVGGADGDAFADLDYTSTFSGTSSSTPLASGVVALVLDMNPALTYRDVMNILAETAVKSDPFDADWVTNGAGFHVNHKYGFGAINANDAVDLAAVWSPVLPETSFSTPTINVNRPIPEGFVGAKSTAQLDTDITLEWVEVVLNVTHANIGDLRVRLTSPDGTTSVLADTRNDGTDNYNNWVFSTTHSWGESSAGTWTLEVADLRTGEVGTFNSWSMNFYGVTTHPPRTGNDSVLTNENTPVTIDVLANDVDPDGSLDPASVIIGTPPANGAVSVDPLTGQITYTPDPGFNGLDAFTYLVRDNEGAPSRFTPVTVDVSGVNDPPVANNDLAFTPLGTAVEIDVLANDSDPDDSLNPSSVTIVSGPSHGSVAVNLATGAVTYTPGPTFTFSDSFSYTVADTFGSVSNIAIVTVEKTNEAPLAENDSFSVNKNSTTSLDVLANDTDADGTIEASTVVIVDLPAKGTATVDPTTGQIRYKPNVNFVGSDAFTYAVRDNRGALSNTAVVSISVLDVGPPVATSNEFALVPGFSSLQASVLGPSDTGLTARLINPPLHGSLVLSPSGTFMFTRGGSFAGLDRFTFVLNDGDEDSNVATIRLISGEFGFVRKLYRDVLNRAASDAEILGWVAAVNAGASRETIALTILSSAEHRTIVINELYMQFLGRSADFGALDHWQAQMQAGLTTETVAATILSSEEYFSRNGFSNTGMVNGFYLDLLG
ncbi:MAG: Ig-like domain-containing protein, partial [Pirellulales bacterium]